MGSIHDVILPLEPKGDYWIGGRDIRHLLGSKYPLVQWYHEQWGLSVLSAVEVAHDEGQPDKGPEYHISISKRPDANAPQRCSKTEAAIVLAAFGLDGWEEDNHVPGGVVRNFWRPVAENLVGMECACKETEALVVEGDYEYRPLPLPTSG